METLYKIQIISDKAPETLELNVEDSIAKVNSELINNKTIFIDNVPYLEDTITAEAVMNCKRCILVANQLVGG
jgi:hypothetical protein